MHHGPWGLLAEIRGPNDNASQIAIQDAVVLSLEFPLSLCTNSRVSLSTSNPDSRCRQRSKDILLHWDFSSCSYNLIVLMPFNRQKQYRSISFTGRPPQALSPMSSNREYHNDPPPTQIKICRLSSNHIDQNEDARLSIPSFGPIYLQENPLFWAAKEEALDHVYKVSSTNNPATSDPGRIKDIYISVIRKIDKKTHDAYRDKFEEIEDPDFRRLMIIDGCFFLQLAITILGGYHLLGYPPDQVLFSDKDLQMWSDAMFFVGNQIPISVLQELMKQRFFQNVIKSGTWHRPSSWSKQILYDLLISPSLVNATSKFNCFCRKRRDSKAPIPCDILQGLRDLVLGPHPYAYEPDDDDDDNYVIDLEANVGNDNVTALEAEGATELFLSATKLRRKGIKIKPLNEGMGSKGIYFKENVGACLYLPVMTVEDDTIVILKHLKRYEINLHFPNQHLYEVCSYIGLMSEILRTRKDVELLANEGVILGTRRNMDRLPRILNRLECNVTTKHLKDVKLQVSDYKGTEWHAFLKKSLSLVVLLTMVQTFYAVLSYHHPNSKFLRIDLSAGDHPTAVAFIDDASSVIVASQALSDDFIRFVYLCREETKTKTKLPMDEDGTQDKNEESELSKEVQTVDKNIISNEVLTDDRIRVDNLEDININQNWPLNNERSDAIP
ncbi:hypothetical protein BUALT_Bualt01G0211400 [Buddleja alternifolia]|uniref:MutS-like protein n=1 Tax=Buddleja alternifolia TaxID=168488 RepID=A0AAV6YD41_9LAMI|nr:hypothetical protein BUALT_Bualt01G0211400 [Buddleja alternifolia]